MQQTFRLPTARQVTLSLAAYRAAVADEGKERATPEIHATIDAMQDLVRRVASLPGMVTQDDMLRAGANVCTARRSLGFTVSTAVSISDHSMQQCADSLIEAIGFARGLIAAPEQAATSPDAVRAWLHQAAAVLAASPALAGELRRVLGMPGDFRVRASLGLPADDEDDDEGDDEDAPLDAPARPLGRAVSHMSDDDVIDDGRDQAREFHGGVQWTAAHLDHMAAKPPLDTYSTLTRRITGIRALGGKQ